MKRAVFRLVPLEVWLVLFLLLLGLIFQPLIPDPLRPGVQDLTQHCLWFAKPGMPNVCI